MILKNLEHSLIIDQVSWLVNSFFPKNLRFFIDTAIYLWYDTVKGGEIMSFASRLKARREQLGITQVQLAEKLGVTKGTMKLA